jgi:TetR/AcrR family transcriptional regulator, cholesterol catabolism regulator
MSQAVPLRTTEPRLNGPRRRAEEIVAAAAAVFAERGYHGASTQDIADRLGMRQASLYYYFRSKEAALEQVCLRDVGMMIERALEVADGGGGPAEKLAGIVRAHLLAIGERQAFVRCILHERRFLPEESRRRINRVMRRYERIVQDVIESGITSGDLRRDLDARLATLALFGLCNAPVDWLGKEPGISVDDIADGFVGFVLAGLSRERAER